MGSFEAFDMEKWTVVGKKRTRKTLELVGQEEGWDTEKTTVEAERHWVRPWQELDPLLHTIFHRDAS